MYFHSIANGQPISPQPKSSSPLSSPSISAQQPPNASVQSPQQSPHHQPLAPHNSPQQNPQSRVADWIEQVQLALAIANPSLLQDIVLHCTPFLIAPHRLGQLSITVGVPIDSHTAVDGVLQFERIACVRAHPSDSPSSAPLPSSLEGHHHRAIVNQVCRETKLQALGMNLLMPDAIALLQHATFSWSDIQRILHLPHDGWHRSWWVMANQADEFSVPFQRLIRCRRYADGTVTLQYKDHFAHLPPPCFRTQPETVLIHIQRPETRFSETLAQINHARQVLGVNYALLIYHSLLELEHQALINQGIYLYHSTSDVTPSPMSKGNAD
ncbi:MAG: hypothetical protein F6K09_11850, partial [Merismopedia sp. SIO2A8]|nr:hypothetical protein [Merismopedia sp. SIO2A8]